MNNEEKFLETAKNIKEKITSLELYIERTQNHLEEAKMTISNLEKLLSEIENTIKKFTK